MSCPTVEPLKTHAYKIRQSKFYPNVPATPFRILISSQSGSGKTTLLVNLLQNVYPLGKVFDRIFIFSHSINIDDSWNPIKTALDGANLPQEEHLFDSYDEDKIEEILNTQHKIIQWQKTHHQKSLMQVCIVLDDMMDDHHACRSSKTLEKLACRGRHLQASVICSVQKYRGMSPVYRINSSDLFVFRLTNQMDLDALLEEFSALASKKELLAIYKKAVEEPYSFLWINKRAVPADTFRQRFDKRLRIAD